MTTKIPVAATTLRASVTDQTPTNPGGPAQVLVDGASTPITANGLADYTPSPGDRLLVQRVGSQVEVVQFLSRGVTPFATSADVAAATEAAQSAQSAAQTAQQSADGKNTIWYTNAAPSGTHVVNDVWFNTANGYSPSYWTGTAWAPGLFGTGAIGGGAVGSNQLANGAVGTPQIQNGAVGTTQLQYASIGTAQIQDAAITSAKIAYLDAGKITTGTLSAISIYGSTIQGSSLATGSSGSYVTIGAMYGGAVDSVTFWNNGTEVGQLSTLGSSGELDLDSYGNMNIVSYGSYGISLNAYNGPIDLEPGTSYVIKSSNTYYDNNTTGTANLIINSSGQIKRTTSVRAAKVAIESLSAADVKGVLDLDVVTWFDRANAEALAAYYDGTASDDALADISIPKRLGGVVADDVAQTFPLLGTYNHDGEIDGVAYDRIGAMLIPLVKDLYDRIEKLEARS